MEAVHSENEFEKRKSVLTKDTIKSEFVQKTDSVYMDYEFLTGRRQDYWTEPLKTDFEHQRQQFNGDFEYRTKAAKYRTKAANEKHEYVTKAVEEDWEYRTQPFYPDGASDDEYLTIFFQKFWNGLTNTSICQSNNVSEVSDIAGAKMAS